MKRDFSQLYSILNVDNDPFRLVWAKCDQRGRRLFLKLAGRPEIMAECSWDQFKPETKQAIRARANDMRDWLNRTLGEPLKVAA